MKVIVNIPKEAFERSQPKDAIVKFEFVKWFELTTFFVVGALLLMSVVGI